MNLNKFSYKKGDIKKKINKIKIIVSCKFFSYNSKY